MSDMYDLIIVGGGPAGLSSAIYACRAGYNTLVIEKLGFGGQMMLTDLIDNFPGFPEGITGFELQNNMTEQAKKFGMQSVTENVVKIDKTDGVFQVKTDENTYKALSVIIATGAKHRSLGIPGEFDFASKGVSYCGTCDGPFFRDKEVYVIGGGDTALTEALFLAKFASKVKIVHRRDRFRAVKSLVDTAAAKNNIEFVFNSIPTEIKGDEKVRSVILKNTKTGAEEEKPIDGVFIFIGLIPNTGFVDKSMLDEENYVKTDAHGTTSIEGLFAAGDVISDTFRQIVCACSDGAKAAEHAGKFIDKLKGNEYK